MATDETVFAPDSVIFASEARAGEIEPFNNLLRGWGITLEETGAKPPMEWMNFLFKRIDLNMQYQRKTGLFSKFDQAFCDFIGGYPVGAVLLSDDGATLRMSLYPDNTENFNEVPGTIKWGSVSGGGSGWDNKAIGELVIYETDKTDGSGNFILPSTNFRIANGDLLLIANHPEYFDMIGTMNGGDGVTTFALPDWRGLVPRFLDMGRGYDSEPSRVLGSEQSDFIRNIVGDFFPDNPNPNANFIGDQIGATGAFYLVNPGSRQGVADVGGVGYGADKLVFDASKVVPTGAENTMKNRASLPLIKVS